MNMPKKITFSSQDAFQLIKEVRKRGCLWDPDNERYNDRYQIAKSWMEIAAIMKFPEVSLRTKWKNLRDLFKKEIKRFGSVEEYAGKWMYFDELKFLDRPEEADTTKTKEEIETLSDGNEEYTFEVRNIQEDEPETSNGTEIYLEEEDPLPEKRFKVSKDQNDEYDIMFLTSLAPYFRELDPIRKLVVRSKMQDLLLNEIAAQTAASNKKKS